MSSTLLWTTAAVVVASVACDLRTRTIPNTVTLGGLGLGLAIRAAEGFADAGIFGLLRGVAHALVGAAVCALIPLVSWRRGELGGGDVKLFAALGALLGPGLGFDVQTISFTLSLLVLFPMRLARHGALPVAIANARIGLSNLVRGRADRLPYVPTPRVPPIVFAPAIGAAFGITLLLRGVP